MTTDYQKQALGIITPMGIKVKVKFLKHDFYFPEDKEKRDIYNITFSRNGKKFSIKFGQSIFGSMEGKQPHEYDVLCCLTKNDPGTFENFISDYGYNVDSINALKIYKAICKEWVKMRNFFSLDELDKLQEIQ